MSHEIEQKGTNPADASAVFSTREGAGWTGLGRAIDPSIAKDPQKIAELLGATWTVQARPAFYQDAEGKFHRITGAAAQVRSDNGKALSLTSDTRYHTTNRQPVDVIEAFRDELAAENMEISHAAILKGGQIIVVSALMDPEFDIVVGKGDRVKSYTSLSTGYDTKNGTKATKGDMRVVCANTLAASLGLAKVSRQIRTIRASTELEYDSLKNLVANVSELVDAQRVAYNDMSNAHMSEADVLRYFADVLEIRIEDLGKVDKQGEKIISTKTENIITALKNAYTNAPGAAIAHGTMWGALNAVTYYGTHEKTVRDTAGDGKDSARVASNLFGDAAKLKARALQFALNHNRIAVAA